MTLGPITGREITPADYNELVSAFLAGGSGGSSGFVNLADYLASPRTPFVTDDTAAFQAAEDYASANGGMTIIVPAGLYYLSAGFNFHKPLTWIGAGGNSALSTPASGTIIRVGDNCNGFVFNKGNTHGDGLGTQGDSSGAKAIGFALYGGNVAVDASGNITSYGDDTSTSGHGVRIRSTFIELNDILCAFFPGDGFNINCSGGAGDSVTGNANNFLLRRCQSIYNYGYGFLVNGTDANAGTIDTCSAISCFGAGFLDYSFLGNNYYTLHVRDCGSNVFDFPCGTCTYGGNKYYVVNASAASTTVPGTDDTVWKLSGTIQAVRPWVSGKTWLYGFPFGTDPNNGNARNVVIGLYTEDGMPPVSVWGPSIVMGGLHANSGFIGTAGHIEASGSGIKSKSFTSGYDGNIAFTTYGPDGQIFNHTDGTNTWSLDQNGANIDFNRSGSGTPLSLTANGLNLPSGKALYTSGTKVVGAQGAAVADATGGATVDTEARAAINALLARMRASTGHGLIA